MNNTILDEDDRTWEFIRISGWAVKYVEGWAADGPPFGYTVGLSAVDHPELLMFGFGAENTALMLDELAARGVGGERLHAGKLVAFDERIHRATLVPVPDSRPYLVDANRLFRSPVPALQVVTDDRRGYFPWEEGYSLPVGRQPLLGQ
ncbi:DUF4262 domain-containing protein [Amycolatopsis magusensis]|uniref:DUF4262 domain-containing protein n=1 Tax=Amycolatopsis magusensis TaxID=882444 RepID=UPI00378A1A88